MNSHRYCAQSTDNSYSKFAELFLVLEILLNFIIIFLSMEFLCNSNEKKIWFFQSKGFIRDFIPQFFCSLTLIYPSLWKISLHLQIYILVDLKIMGWNIYKTSMYNRNLSFFLTVSIFLSTVNFLQFSLYKKVRKG